MIENSQIETIKKAANILRADGLVAFPTETVYGLGANALSDSAVAKIYAAKNRPQFNPLITHVLDADSAFSYVIHDKRAEKLMEKFWPGALTIILPRREDCKLSLLASAGLDSIALRVPDNDIAQALLKESQLPIAAPSANRSGRISPTSALHVADEFSDNKIFILRGGDCRVGIESTIIDLSDLANKENKKPTILRHGSITKEMLEAVLGEELADFNSHNLAIKIISEIKSPGMMLSHYAPETELRINAVNLEEGEALLAFGEIPNELAKKSVFTLNLSPSGNLQEAAANLFAMLRELDKKRAKKIAAMKIPMQGLGIAINDRLTRASTR